MQASYIKESQVNLVEEPQLGLRFMDKQMHNNIENNQIESQTLNVLSLFSGCGGMDLGFEGGFSVYSSCINELLTPHFIEKKIDKNYVQLKETRFKTVFANDILSDARNAWVNHFSKKGYDAELFRTDSIVDLVKLHNLGVDIFPENIDVVTGGFPCQDFSLSGKRNGFKSHKNHIGEIIKDDSPSAETRGQLYMWMNGVS